MNRRITLETASTADDSGAPEDSFTTLATVWAAREDVTGDEKFRGAEVMGIQRTTWHIRYRDDLTERDRITEFGLHYDIESLADPDGAKRFLEVVTVRRRA